MKICAAAERGTSCVDGYLCVLVCVGLSWVGLAFEVLFVLPWPPKWKSFWRSLPHHPAFLPLSHCVCLPPTYSIHYCTSTQTHTHAGSRDDLPVPLHCHSASNFSLIQTQTAFPSSVFDPWELGKKRGRGERGKEDTEGGYRGDFWFII